MGSPRNCRRAVLGIVMNIVLFVSIATVVGYFTGWVYGRLFPSLRSTCASTSASGCTTSIAPASWVVVVAVILGVGSLVVGLLWVLRRWTPGADPVWRRAAVWSAIAAALWAVLALAVPQVLAWLVRSSIPRRGHTAAPASTGIRHYWIPLGGLGGLLVAIRAAIAEFAALAKTSSSSGLGGLLRRWRAPLTNLVGALAIPVLFGGLLVLFMYNGAQHSVFVPGTSAAQWLGVAGPAAVLAAITYFGDLNSWSLHTIYKARLGDTFNLERYDAIEPDGTPPEVRVRTRRTPLPLSNLQLDNFPEVLICATSNLTSYGQTPSGVGAAPFLFSPETVGGPVVGTCDTRTFELDGLRMPRNLTVMDAVSISGAAVSPEMGKMTRAPMRALLALANIRLGVWLPKPNAVAPPGSHGLRRSFGATAQARRGRQGHPVEPERPPRPAAGRHPSPQRGVREDAHELAVRLRHRRRPLRQPGSRRAPPAEPPVQLDLVRRRVRRRDRYVHHAR